MEGSKCWSGRALEFLVSEHYLPRVCTFSRTKLPRQEESPNEAKAGELEFTLSLPSCVDSHCSLGGARGQLGWREGGGGHWKKLSCDDHYQQTKQTQVIFLRSHLNNTWRISWKGVKPFYTLFTKVLFLVYYEEKTDVLQKFLLVNWSTRRKKKKDAIFYCVIVNYVT